jgi:hypothetical protein
MAGNFLGSQLEPEKVHLFPNLTALVVVWTLRQPLLQLAPKLQILVKVLTHE